MKNHAYSCSDPIAIIQSLGARTITPSVGGSVACAKYSLEDNKVLYSVAVPTTKL